MRYILVKVDDRKDAVAVELCKEFEQFDGVAAAIIVGKANEYAASVERAWECYIGEFYSTPQAIDRFNFIGR